MDVDDDGICCSTSATNEQQSFFKEKEQVMIYIHTLTSYDCTKEDSNTDVTFEDLSLLQAYEGAAMILNKYQEQSQLLDPYLEEMITPLMCSIQHIIQTHEAEQQALREEQSSFPFQVYKNAQLHKLFQLIYHLCKVRGYKTIVKFFPHEAADLEPTLHMLQSQDKQDYATWETRYVLLLWLSMLCLIPFDLTTIDSSILAPTAGAGQEEGTIIFSIITLCKNYLNDPGPTKEAAAVCLSRLLSRPDMEASHIQQFLHWIVRILDACLLTEQHEESSSDVPVENHVFLITGIFFALAQLSKCAHRENFVHLTPIYFDRIIQCSSASKVKTKALESDTLQRKLLIKLIQRIGLTYLPPRLMSWRYQRGHRTLLFQKSDEQGEPLEPEKAEQVRDVQVNVPDQMEDIIEVLLSGLRDRDTVVRWSAAKGIGRLTGRLPFDLADEIVQCVLELFAEHESDAAWHGGALALAELAMRGLLLPDRLPEVVGVVLKALQYDVRRGSNSVGAHVRDAACYLCWSFARAYAPRVMKPYVRRLGEGMLLTACFDREVNCRRAASAAFQENVGRQGMANFPHGIAIVTKADYARLGNRELAFVSIATDIAAIREQDSETSSSSGYREVFLEHLVSKKVGHWDPAIRILAAKALYRLTCASSHDHDLLTAIYPKLMRQTLSPELTERHGATLAVADITLALAQVPTLIPGEVLKTVRNVVMCVEKARLYRGRGGEIMRHACCLVIQSLAISNQDLSVRTQYRLLETLDECLRHPTADIQTQAVSAYRSLGHRYFRLSCPKLLAKTLHKFVDVVMNHRNVAYRRGYVQALGASPRSLVGSSKAQLDQVLETLMNATTLEEQVEDRDAESRRLAVKALIELAMALGIEPTHGQNHVGLSPSQVSAIFDTFLNALEDYSMDDRGDVGSWVRREAMLALKQLVVLLAEAESGETKSTTKSAGLVPVYVPCYGRGHLVGQYGGQEYPVYKVQFDAGTMGFVHFQPLGIGLFATHPSAEGASQVEFLTSLATEESSFVIPSMETRREYLTSSPVAGSLSSSVNNHLERHLSSSMVKRLFSALLKQLSEKLDTIRDTAGQILFDLLHSTAPHIPFIPDRPQLQVIFPPTLTSINWASAPETFPLCLEVMDIPAYTRSLTSGLMISVGGLTESVVKSSQRALMSWCRRHVQRQNFGLLSTFMKYVLEMFVTHAKCDRVMIPLLKTLSILSDVPDFFSKFHGDGPAFGLSIYTAVASEMYQCVDVGKLQAGVRVVLGLLPSEATVEKRTLGGVLVLLGHRFPKVRKFTAEQFYTKLIMHEELWASDEDVYDEMLSVLSETLWDGPIAQVYVARDTLYRLFDVVKPEKKKKCEQLNPATVASNAAEEDDYTYLVKETGY